MKQVDWFVAPYSLVGLHSGGDGSIAYYNWYVTEFRRFVESQQNIEKLAQSFIDYPAMQDPASFNLDAIKKKIEKMKSLGG